MQQSSEALNISSRFKFEMCSKSSRLKKRKCPSCVHILPIFVFFETAEINKMALPSGQALIYKVFGQRQANLVLIAYASSEGSGETAHPRSLARTFAAHSYKK